MTDEQILAAAMEVIRRAGGKAPPAASVLSIWQRWAAAHQDLQSFATERGRAARLLAWRPADGPFAGVRLARRDPMSLTPVDVDMWRADQRSRITRRKRPTSPAWRNRCVMLLLRVLNFAVSRKTIPNNPIAGIEPEREAPARDVMVTEAEVARILAAIEHPVVRAWAIVAFESGMRRGEMLKLCWRQLDFAAGVIHIPAEHTKARKARDVEFPARSQAALRELTRVLGADHVFANPATRRPYDGRWIHELFVRAVEASGVVGTSGRPPRLHDLRRSYVTLFCDRGGPETVVMEFSGHTDPSVFRRYRVVRKDARTAAMERNAAGRAAELAALKK